MTFFETISILDTMKQNLTKKGELDNNEDGSIKREISALRNIIRFTHIIFRCFPKGFIKKIIKEDTIRNDNMIKKIIEKYYQNNKNESNEDSIERIYFDDIKLKFNRKLDFSIIKYNGNTYIIMEPKRFNKNMLQWKNWETFNFPVEALKENQFRKKINESNT
jgi:hypothetical protein